MPAGRICGRTAPAIRRGLPITSVSSAATDARTIWCTPARKYCIIGTASDAARKITQFESFGVTGPYIRGFYSYELPAELCGRFSRDVMPLMPA